MSEAEKVVIQVSAEGTAETAKELDKVTAALEKQKSTEESIQKTSAGIQRKNRIELLKAEAKEVNNVGAAFRTLQTNAAPANDVMQKATFQFGQFRAASAASSALVGNLGRSFAQFVPQAGGFTSAIQSGGMAMSQFLGVLGGGAGMAVGGVVAAVGLLVTYFAKSAEEADKLAEATKKNAEELKTYLETIKGIRATVAERVQVAAAGQEYEGKFSRGELKSDQYAVEEQTAKATFNELHELRTRMGFLRKQIERLYASGLVSVEDAKKSPLVLAYGELRAKEAEIEKLPYRGEQARVFKEAALRREQSEGANAYELKKIQLAEEAAKAEAERRSEAEAAYKAGLFKPQSSDSIQGQVEGLKQQQRESQERETALTAQQSSNELQFAMDAANKKYKLEKELSDKAFKEHGVRERAKRQLEERNLDALRERNKAFTDAATNAGQMGATTAIKMFSDLAKGHKLAIGAVLEGIGDQMVAEGTRVMFQAAAMAFFPPTAPFAAGLAAVGASEIAVGIGLGAAGARGAGGSNSGGGGGGGNTNYADPFANTATYGGEPRGPTVININMPTVLSPTAEDGRRIEEALIKNRHIYGSRL